MSILDWTPVVGVTFALGDVLSAIITFLITAFVLFLIIKVANKTKSAVIKEGVEVIVVPTEGYLIWKKRKNRFNNLFINKKTSVGLPC